MIDDNGINVQYWDLPTSIHGLVRRNEDGSYTIILNGRDSRERNREAYKHEYEQHILHDDFQQDDADMIERRAHA